MNSFSLEAPGSILKPSLGALTNIRKLALRHLSLPRSSFLAVKAVEDDPNPLSGLYNFNHPRFRPWYVKPTFWTRWGPVALLLIMLGGRAPGLGVDWYHPHGYDLQTIGPNPQEGKGLDEMGSTVAFLKARGSAGCPFSHGGKI